jgi:hypothetical protein
MKILITILVLSVSLPVAKAVDLGWHQSGSKSFGEVFELEKRADRVLHLDKHMKFDLGIGRIEKAEGGRLDSRRSTKFDFAEIEDFLKEERHKDLLVIWFDKTIMWNEEAVIADFTSKSESLLRPTGYKRIIILGAHGSGVHFVLDKSFDSK